LGGAAMGSWLWQAAALNEAAAKTTVDEPMTERQTTERLVGREAEARAGIPKT